GDLKEVVVVTQIQRIRRPNNGKWKNWRRDIATGAVLSVFAVGTIAATATSAFAATTLQVTNLSHVCGAEGFTGHTDFTGGTDSAMYSLQAHVNTSQYPDDFLAGTFSTTGGEYHADNVFQNNLGAQAVPPDTATSVTFTVYDINTGPVATFDSTLPACTPANSPPT